jgi:hypothetical protein
MDVSGAINVSLGSITIQKDQAATAIAGGLKHCVAESLL